MKTITRRKLDAFDDEFDSDYWAERFYSEAYVRDDDEYDDFEPAYRFGTSLREETDDFDADEEELKARWESVKGDSTLTWKRAKDAVRAAWEWTDDDEEEDQGRDPSSLE